MENFEIILDLLIVNDMEKIDFFGVGENVFFSIICYYCFVYCVLKFFKLYIRIFIRKIWLFVEINFNDYKISL